ncbi:hypothetical protein NA66_102663 [Burkholderia pyrrocinia]|uniref:Uncharacterized protein n=1 Tax=Burkholderia pyrrocinia TaxID=60550 RepID=A0A318I4D1_BURPY|nr:hypothetical protein NA66_102663 [Burkholderia pyrrocinia]
MESTLKFRMHTGVVNGFRPMATANRRLSSDV